MAQVFLSIVALLSDPNPSDPINWEAARVLRDDPDNYNRMVRDMVARQRGGRTTRRVGRGSASRSMASNAGEIEGQGEDAAEGTNNGDERGVGEYYERDGGAAGEAVVGDLVDDGVNNEDRGAVEQIVGGPRDGQAHEHLAQEEDEEEALAREGAGEENVVQEGNGGEDFAHEGDGEEDLEQNGVQ